MERIGEINNREIYYISTKEYSEWIDLLPTEKWVVFTIVDKEEDRAILYESTAQILDKNATYTCCAGELAGLTEEYFDGEIALRGVLYEDKTGKKYDFEQSPITTTHRNFGEGFWFASTLVYDGEKEIDKVVCVEFTTRKVKKHLTELINEINNGWLPCDAEVESAQYDS